MLDLASSGASEPPLPEASPTAQYLSLAHASASALLRLVNDLLDLSRMEAGMLQLAPIEFRLDDSICDLLRSFAGTAHKKGLELACHLGPDVPVRVVADRGRLEQVLGNLVGNAVKFTRRGEVVIQVRRVKAEDGADDEDLAAASLLDPGHCLLHFTVSDTGPGVPVEQQEAIFRPFVQGGGTDRGGGSGLGLSIAAELARLMGGRLCLDSTVGQGSCFHFLTRVQPLEAPLVSRFAEGWRMLVADDCEPSRLFVTELCRGWGATVTAACNGPEVLAATSAATFDVVLLDSAMPVLDSASIVRRLLQQSNCPRILFLEQVGGPAERGEDEGVAGVVRKPIKARELLAALQGARDRAPLDAVAIDRAVPAARWRVLLVEDDPVIRFVAQRYLEEVGHSVRTVESGQAAVEAAAAESFDVALMDLNMPAMTGLEATAAIRAYEQGTGKRLPILALTALAMPADRERCLAAGCDGYISKPVRGPELLAAMAGILGASRSRGPEYPAAEARNGVSVEPTEVVVLDREVLMSRALGQADFVRTIAGVFRDQAPGYLADLATALRLRDTRKLADVAHKVKGSADLLGGRATRAAAIALEQLGRTGDLAGAEPAAERLRVEIERLRDALSAVAS
jgi:CheY-like chemotaxis protein/HPt (histidine-containing phosphotransfer) domain-containing protein